MDIFLVALGLICLVVGVLGSFLPVLPGLPISWVGLLLVHLTSVVPMNFTYLSIWLVVAIVVLFLDYFIPALGTKKYGGSKYGVWGTTLGLLVGMFFPPFGFILGPFIGAYLGEMYYKNDSKIAAKAAWGSFIGFLTSTFMKFVVSLVYVGLYVSKVLEYWDVIF